jgi:hypothetical protein
LTVKLPKSRLIMMADGRIAERGADEMGCGCGDFAREGFYLLGLIDMLNSIIDASSRDRILTGNSGSSSAEGIPAPSKYEALSLFLL